MVLLGGRLHSELCAENVAQFGTVTVAAAGHLRLLVVVVGGGQEVSKNHGGDEHLLLLVHHHGDALAIVVDGNLIVLSAIYRCSEIRTLLLYFYLFI